MRPSGNRFTAGATVLFFLAGITFPLVAWLVHGIPVPGRLGEERLANPLPPWPRDLASLSSFARGFELWFGDALGGRETLLRWRSREYVVLLGVSSTPMAYIGKDRWLFLSEGREFDMDRGASPLGRFELDAWVRALHARQAFCREQGAEYVFVMAPDKTSIYPEKHAHVIPKVGPSRTDQLQAALANDAVFLDLRPSQLNQKQYDAPNHHTYYPYGTHWTDRGAAAGMRVLGERVRRLPGAAHWRPLDEDDLVYGAVGVNGDNWASRMYLNEEMLQSEPAVASVRGRKTAYDLDGGGGDIRLAVITSDDPSLPRVLMFHDSFGAASYPLVAYSASRCTALWDFFDPRLVAKEKPDLVIELFVERLLSRPPVENVPQQGDFVRRLFESGRPLFSLDVARDVHALEADGGIEARVEDGAIAIHWLRPTAVATLPAGALPDGAHVVVRLEVEVPEPTDANFHFKTGTTAKYTRGNSFTKVLPKGRSELFLHFTAPDIRGPIAFRVNRSIEFRLLACEARLLE